MRLDLRTPDGPLINVPVRAVKARDATGEFTLLPAHAPFVTVLEPCILIYRQAEGGERYVAVDGGLLLLESGQVTVVTRDAVGAESVESAGDATAGMLRARGEQEVEATKAFADLTRTLIRALPALEEGR